VSSRHPPLTHRQIIAALALLGFEYRKPTSGTSHQYYIGTFRGAYRKVTVDPPKSPFGQDLIASMAKQAGLTKSELYAAVNGNMPANWP
jgi:predicted RNA binding protein YcfA (HicA-like mRNA interferase family)